MSSKIDYNMGFISTYNFLESLGDRPNLTSEELSKLKYELENENISRVFGLNEIDTFALRTCLNNIVFNTKTRFYQCKMGENNAYVEKLNEEFRGKDIKLNNGAIITLPMSIDGFKLSIDAIEKLGFAVKEERLKNITLSIGEIRDVNFDELCLLYGNHMACILRDCVHNNGYLLNGEIPEDLINMTYLHDLHYIGKKTVLDLRKVNITTLGQITTYGSEEEVLKFFENTEGLGLSKFVAIKKFIEDSGFKFSSREEKVKEYQKIYKKG